MCLNNIIYGLYWKNLKHPVAATKLRLQMMKICLGLKLHHTMLLSPTVNAAAALLCRAVAL